MKKRCPIVSTWVFRVEIASDKTPWSKEIKQELTRLLFESKLWGNFYLEEDFGASAIHLESKTKVQKS